MLAAPSRETLRAALAFLPPWLPVADQVRAAKALKSALGKAGYELFDWWSTYAAGIHRDRITSDLWREAKVDGNVGIEVLLKLAQEWGWPGEDPPVSQSKAELPASSPRQKGRRAKTKVDPIDLVRPLLDVYKVRPLDFDARTARGLVLDAGHGTTKQRTEAARSLLVHIATLLHCRLPIPEPAMTWFSEAMVRFANMHERPEVAFGLQFRGRPRARGPQNPHVLYMHALIHWGIPKERAADIVARFGDVKEASGLVKAYNRTAKVWEFDGPDLTDREPGELEWRATARHFLDGRRVVVSIMNPHSLSTSSVWLWEDFRAFVAKEGTFRCMD
ncbi:MAG: hypothetical protein WA210_00505 [Burkholderiaceae bacterium]